VVSANVKIASAITIVRFMAERIAPISRKIVIPLHLLMD
jgi:hypothetical protein